MGMSASQARLLSITSRLTNNEFRSQTITNSKLRLAEKSEEASAQYMDALNSQQLVFGVYSDNGEYSLQKLTPALIYDYAPLKNQYALVNPAGKMLVSNVDAKNFEATINEDNPLAAFLDKYGLLETKTYTQKVEKENPNYEDELAEYEAQKPAYDAYIKYLADKEQYDIDYKNWLLRNGYNDYSDYEAAYDKYEEDLASENLYDIFASVVGTSDTVTNTGAQGHYYRALKENNAGCYLHVLNTLIDYNGTNLSNAEFNTSIEGTKVTLDGADGGMTHDMSATEKADFAKISGLLSERYCDGDDDFNTTGKQNLLKAARDDGREPTPLEILRSDFKETAKGDGTYSYEPKTLEQKIIDLYYIIKNKATLGVTNVDMTEMLMNFTDGDMKKLAPQAPQAPPTEPTPVPFAECPDKPSNIFVEYQDASIAVVKDKDKAQWYTNLWYMMNGSDTVNKIKQAEIHDDEKNESYSVFVVDSAEKSGKGGTYEVFEDLNLFKSDSWLQFALEHGMVTMVQAQYDNPAADSGKVPELTSEGITWKSIIYTNASDIRSQEDEVKIALAEVKYKNAIREIENKDKKFDQDLKKLDTEHTALQTEYDSIKEVISKNVDRSFKAFS